MDKPEELRAVAELRERLANAINDAAGCGWSDENAWLENGADCADAALYAIGLPLLVLVWAVDHPDILAGLADGTMVARIKEADARS